MAYSENEDAAMRLKAMLKTEKSDSSTSVSSGAPSQPAPSASVGQSNPRKRHADVRFLTLISFSGTFATGFGL